MGLDSMLLATAVHSKRLISFFLSATEDPAKIKIQTNVCLFIFIRLKRSHIYRKTFYFKMLKDKKMTQETNSDAIFVF